MISRMNIHGMASLTSTDTCIELHKYIAKSHIGWCTTISFIIYLLLALVFFLIDPVPYVMLNRAFAVSAINRSIGMLVHKYIGRMNIDLNSCIIKLAYGISCCSTLLEVTLGVYIFLNSISKPNNETNCFFSEVDICPLYTNDNIRNNVLTMLMLIAAQLPVLICFLLLGILLIGGLIYEVITYISKHMCKCYLCYWCSRLCDLINKKIFSNDQLDQSSSEHAYDSNQVQLVERQNAVIN